MCYIRSAIAKLKIFCTNVELISDMKLCGFGLKFAREIRKKRAGHHSNWKWHLDEVFVKINGERFYLWRAVDHEGEVLEGAVRGTLAGL